MVSQLHVSQSVPSLHRPSEFPPDNLALLHLHPHLLLLLALLVNHLLSHLVLLHSLRFLLYPLQVLLYPARLALRLFLALLTSQITPLVVYLYLRSPPLAITNALPGSSNRSAPSPSSESDVEEIIHTLHPVVNNIASLRQAIREANQPGDGLFSLHAHSTKAAADILCQVLYRKRRDPGYHYQQQDFITDGRATNVRVLPSDFVVPDLVSRRWLVTGYVFLTP